MIQITKDEAMMLQKGGYKFGKSLHRSYSSSPKYYATEEWKLLKTLDKYRKSRIIYVKE